MKENVDAAEQMPWEWLEEVAYEVGEGALHEAAIEVVAAIGWNMNLVAVAASVDAEAVAGVAKIGHNFAPAEPDTIALAAETAVAVLAVGAAAVATSAADGVLLVDAADEVLLVDAADGVLLVDAAA